MIDERELLKRAARRFSPDVGIVERVYQRRDRKRRNRRIGTAALALILAVVATAGLASAFRNSNPQPADHRVGVPHVKMTRHSVRGFALMNLQGEKLGEFPKLPPQAAEVTASPDGTTVAFMKRTSKGRQIFTIGVDGADLRQITRRHDAVGSTSLPEEFGSPTWSPDGSHLAFLRFHRAGDILAANADGTDPHVVTECGVAWDVLIAQPKWSPDGSRILCSGVAGGYLRILSTDLNTGFTTTLAGGEGTNAWNGDWSPDGTTIAFSRAAGRFDRHLWADRSYDIWIMDADGSNQHPLVESDDGADVGPFWSPDGSMIAYTSVGETRSVWVVDVASGRTRLVGPGTVFGWLTPTTLIVGSSA